MTAVKINSCNNIQYIQFICDTLDKKVLLSAYEHN